VTRAAAGGGRRGLKAQRAGQQRHCRGLGRPARFLNMMRVFKPTSPMSVGTWILTGYAPAALASAASDITGLLPAVGFAGTVAAAALGPALASYTGVLLADTAIPAWHDARRELLQQAQAG
jgi:formate-dependent nitrite reductase membrane component NrfD